MDFMQIALDLARLGCKKGEVPVGAVLVREGIMIAGSHNLVEQSKNPLMHAEMVVLAEGCRALGSKYLTDCDLYVSLEPCAMCAAAISFTRVEKLFYGARDVKRGAVEGNLGFFNKAESAYVRPKEIYEALSESESSQIMKNFFESIRKERK